MEDYGSGEEFFEEEGEEEEEVSYDEDSDVAEINVNSLLPDDFIVQQFSKATGHEFHENKKSSDKLTVAGAKAVISNFLDEEKLSKAPKTFNTIFGPAPSLEDIDRLTQKFERLSSQFQQSDEPMTWETIRKSSLAQDFEEELAFIDTLKTSLPPSAESHTKTLEQVEKAMQVVLSDQVEQFEKELVKVKQSLEDSKMNLSEAIDHVIKNGSALPPSTIKQENGLENTLAESRVSVSTGPEIAQSESSTISPQLSPVRQNCSNEREIKTEPVQGAAGSAADMLPKWEPVREEDRVLNRYGHRHIFRLFLPRS